MIGVDLIDIRRIAALRQRFGDKALQRFMSDDEIARFGSRIESVAGVWAAKEAVSKALGCGICGDLGFHDIAIGKDEMGAPYAVLSDQAAKRFGVSSLSVSITHEKTHAAAVALALIPPRPLTSARSLGSIK
ncbi:MAG: holo-ACP synthase [Helicobacteraceae bacterium]|jgi:holo-[acyl-carrier protein] synthase|nr:holo-ACP synthase [Helicobacteraceae bacterium]